MKKINISISNDDLDDVEINVNGDTVAISDSSRARDNFADDNYEDDTSESPTPISVIPGPIESIVPIDPIMDPNGLFVATVNEERKQAPFINPPMNGIIDRGARLMDSKTIEDFINLVLFNQINLPIDDKSTEIVKFIPGHTVSGSVGPCRSDVLVLGKTPNAQESNMGRFQPDKLGQTWKPYLRNKGINIDDWFLYTVVPFKIPDYLAGKGALKQCHLNETQCLLSYVYNLVKPKYVLCFGADALSAIYKLFDPKKYKSIKFTNSRGSVLELPDGTKVVCCNAPGMILKDPNQTDEFNRDLDLLAEVITNSGKSERKLSCKYRVIDNFNELEKYIAEETEFHSKGLHKKYSLDMEWGANETLRTIQLATSSGEAVVIHLTRANLVPTEIGSDLSKTLEYLGRILLKDQIGILGHNVRGDIKILRRKGLDLMDNFIQWGFDTMISYHLIPGNETLDKQLELVAIKMLNVGRYDKPLRDWLSKSGMSEKDKELLGYGTVPDEIIIPYGAMDACVTFELAEVIVKELPKYPKLEQLYYKYQHVLNLPILEMEENGMLIDQLRLKDLTKLFQDKVQELLKDLQRKVNWEPRRVTEERTSRGKQKFVEVDYDGFNPDSSDQLKEVLFGIFKEKDGVSRRQAPNEAAILNLIPIKATDDTPWLDVIAKGKQNVYNPSTDSESLGILSAEHPLAKDIQRYKFVSQITKNFLRPYVENEDGTTIYDSGLGGSIGSDGRARTSFRTVLETGRYSTSPNYNNLPKKQEKELQIVFTENGKLNSRFKSIKSVFIADPGWVFIESDWNQAELYTMGSAARDQKFLDVLKNSDLHTYNLQKMFCTKLYKDKPISEYTIAELNKLRKSDVSLDALRVSAKSVSFGKNSCLDRTRYAILCI